MESKVNSVTQAEAKTAAAPGRRSEPAPSPAESVYERVLDLQKSAGNQSVQQWMRSARIQAKSLIADSRDAGEREADRTAELVLNLREQAPYAAPEGMPRRFINAFSPNSESFQKPPAGLLDRNPAKSAGKRIQARPVPAITPFMETRLKHAEALGRPLPDAMRALFEPRFGHDFSRVQVHADPPAAQLARDLEAQAFTRGEHIFFAAGAFAPDGEEGRRLLAHELTHTIQQEAAVAGHGPENTCGNAHTVLSGRGPAPGSLSSGSVQAVLAPARTPPVVQLSKARAPAGGLIQREPNCGAAPERGEAEEMPEAGDTDAPVADVPDDEIVDASIEWPEACTKNFEWWSSLQLNNVQPIRNYDPETQPRAWANRTLRVQRLLYEQGIGRIEGVRLLRDGIFGPRTWLALSRVALDENHPARAQVQGEGFDLEAIAAAEATTLRARAEAVKPEFLIQVPVRPLGESAVRYYDINFHMVTQDRDVLARLFFDGIEPEGIRREDYIELLRRAYGQGSRMLEGTAALVRVNRDFIHREIDISRAVARDDRESVERVCWFTFFGTSAAHVSYMDGFFHFSEAMQGRYDRLTEERRQDVDEAMGLLRAGDEAPPEGEEHTATAAVLVAVYLPALEAERRTALVETYLAEKREQESAEREAIESHNREAAQQRADRLAALIEAEDMYRPERFAAFEAELTRGLREGPFFHLVLEDLHARPGNLFERLYDEVEALGSERVLSALLELSLGGPYADHPRVRRALAALDRMHAGHREHVYIAEGDGAVLLDGDDRLEVGQVAGEVNGAYLRDEDRERLRPEAEERLTAEFERQARIYMERVVLGLEPERSQEEIGEHLLQLAWTAADMDEDRDIEEIEIEESIRLLGVRRRAASPDGAERYDVNYEVVHRIVDYTDWEPVRDAATGWQTEEEFEYRMFWYSYSQTADVITTAAKIVAFGAVAVMAWEVGAIGLLVRAAGGGVAVGVSVGISVAIYMLTHERWTLEGLLLAGLEGYLVALGFRLFAPVGRGLAGLVLPRTLEQVTLRRLLAAWLVRHGATGGLVGGSIGPASLFVHDLVRIVSEGGEFSPFSAYLITAGCGLVLGAVLEIGGSALLAPLFRTADQTVLRSVVEVVERLRGAGISPSQWMAEAGGALSNFRAWLGANLDDAVANGILRTVRTRVEEVGRAYLSGGRLMLQRQIFELSGGPLSREAVDGLERLLRVGGAVDETSMATLLQHVNQTPERVAPWLRLVGGMDETVLRGLIESNQLRALADASATLTLIGRRSAAEFSALFTARFNSSVAEFETFAARLGALEPTTADTLLGLLQTRGTAVTPASLLRLAESGAGLGEDMLAGLQRLIDKSGAGNVEALLGALPNDQVGVFLNTARTASGADLDLIQRLLVDFGPERTAWAVRLPLAEAETLLRALSADSRTAIGDILATEARDLMTALGPATVDRALTGGAALGLRGSHLRTLRQYLHDATVVDYLNWAGTTASRLRKVLSLATDLGATGARFASGGRITGATIALDSNAVFGIEQLMQGTPFAGLTPNLQEAVNAVRSLRGLGPYSDPPAGTIADLDYIVGPGADLRTSVGASAEIAHGAGGSGTSPVLGDLTGVTTARTHPDYAAVIAELERTAVGGPKGAVDRSVVADVMFAETEAGVVPTMVSGDQDVVVRLARNFAVDPVPFTPAPGSASNWAQLATTYPGGRFTVDILGHRLQVAFRP